MKVFGRVCCRGDVGDCDFRGDLFRIEFPGYVRRICVWENILELLV
jgi:hypothetical protein